MGLLVVGRGRERELGTVGGEGKGGRGVGEGEGETSLDRCAALEAPTMFSYFGCLFASKIWSNL